MAVKSADTEAPPAGIAALAERYDPEVIDLPGSRALLRLTVTGSGEWDVRLTGRRLRLLPSPGTGEPDARITADATTWRQVAEDVRGGMRAFQRGRLTLRGSLHLGVGFLAATSGSDEPGRLRFETVRTRSGRVSILFAGRGRRTLLCLHGLGATKASFLPTVAALADDFRVVAMDLPGFGESDKPIGAPYNSAWFARTVFDTLDSLGLDRADLAGNSMGGRIALEAGMTEPERVRSLTLLCPALAWLRDRRWALLVKVLRPELGLVQPAPRRVVEAVVRRFVPGGDDGWSAAGVDEFLRAYLNPRGRAAFYAAARNIYLDEPRGDHGFWSRLAELQPKSLFIWGRDDMLVPIGFRRHVEKALPAARHRELPCGHVPQLERPRETHAAMRKFLKG